MANKHGGVAYSRQRKIKATCALAASAYQRGGGSRLAGANGGIIGMASAAGI